MSEYIYVLGMDGKPQMPTRRRRHVNKLLNTGKARIAEHVPFTIQLLYENEPVLQQIMMAEDPGRTNIGAAVVGLKGQLYLSAVVETRNEKEYGIRTHRNFFGKVIEVVKTKPYDCITVDFGNNEEWAYNANELSLAKELKDMTLEEFSNKYLVCINATYQY